MAKLLNPACSVKVCVVVFLYTNTEKNFRTYSIIHEVFGSRPPNLILKMAQDCDDDSILYLYGKVVYRNLTEVPIHNLL